MKKILAADIGGTNSRFAYFQWADDQFLSLVESKWLKTREVSSFGRLLNQLQSSTFPLPVREADIAVFAIAGPVEQGRFSHPPYIPWEVDLSNADQKFGLKQWELINDFVAQAYACRSPIIEAALQIIPGEVDPTMPLVVIGAGTALGQAALVPDCRDGYEAFPSEVGHTPFPFVSGEEFGYMNFLLREGKDPYVLANTVVSGKGLSLIHEYLTGEKLEPAEVAVKLREDSETLTWMARFYGRACRIAALQVVARGGVYVAGGVAARTPQLVTHPSFKAEFTYSKTMESLLNKIPVFLNVNEESGLWGAALRGVQRLKAKGRNGPR
ncbi:MAG: glucokinase [Deltaproteobacteria bacterium]|nr:glucokinase [Deltaproteobacteria bacterium]